MVYGMTGPKYRRPPGSRPVPGESEYDTGPPDYHSDFVPPPTSTQNAVGKAAVDAIKRKLLEDSAARAANDAANRDPARSAGVTPNMEDNLTGPAEPLGYDKAYGLEGPLEEHY